MSNDLNLCQFIGRLTADPETRAIASTGTTVVNASIAVNRKYKGEESAEFVRLVFFGKLGDIVSQYCRKGARVYVSGRMQTRSWDESGGQGRRYMTEIIAQEMQMLDSRGQGRPHSAPVNEVPRDDFDSSLIPF